MKEPKLYPNDFSGDGVPFSSLGIAELRSIASGDFHVDPSFEEGDCDCDFAMRYAALLLKERGAL